MAAYEEVRMPWPDWKIAGLLGKGAFGNVYEIRRRVMDREERAALKIISIPRDPGELEADYSEGYDDEAIRAKYGEYLTQIIREYQLMAEMKGHPNIVSCEDFYTLNHEEGIGWDVYIRMELLTPLQTILRKRALMEDEILRLGKDICKALAACEKKKIIHRDIKPANIMRSDFGDYKLGDFGIARTMDHTTHATVAGTERYMAPEVILQKKYGREVDIYSLGLVLYWLLNRRRMPFLPIDRVPGVEEAAMAQHRRLRGEPFPEPADGSPAFKAVVLRACAYDPKERYAGAMEMLKDLEKVSLGGDEEEDEDRTERYTGKPYGGMEDPDRTVAMKGSYRDPEETVPFTASAAKPRKEPVKPKPAPAPKPKPTPTPKPAPAAKTRPAPAKKPAKAARPKKSAKGMLVLVPVLAAAGVFVKTCMMEGSSFVGPARFTYMQGGAVELEYTSEVLEAGGKEPLSVRIEKNPFPGDLSRLTCSSTNEKVVRWEDGMLIAGEPGSANLTFSYMGKEVTRTFESMDSSAQILQDGGMQMQNTGESLVIEMPTELGYDLYWCHAYVEDPVLFEKMRDYSGYTGDDVLFMLPFSYDPDYESPERVGLDLTNILAVDYPTDQKWITVIIEGVKEDENGGVEAVELYSRSYVKAVWD